MIVVYAQMGGLVGNGSNPPPLFTTPSSMPPNLPSVNVGGTPLGLLPPPSQAALDQVLYFVSSS